MPELPECEAARAMMEAKCCGKRILKATADEDEKLFVECSPAEIKAALEGRILVAAHRHGKQLWFELDSSGPWPLLHFGMTGALVVQGTDVTKYKRSLVDASQWPPRFTKLQLELEGGVHVAFVDPRRFGRFRLQTDPQSQEPLSKLGFDTLLDLPALDQFSTLLRARGGRIKALLLDQSFAAGVGNWVADEVLYQARVHPEQPVAGLSDATVAALHQKLGSVVRTAVAAGANDALYPKDWMFHYRWGKGSKESSSVGGHKVVFVTAGGRTSAIVPALQKLQGAAATAAAVAAVARTAAPGKAGKPRARGKAAAKGTKGPQPGDQTAAEDDRESGAAATAAVVVAAAAASSAADAAADSAAAKPSSRGSRRGQAATAPPPPRRKRLPAAVAVEEAAAPLEPVSLEEGPAVATTRQTPLGAAAPRSKRQKLPAGGRGKAAAATKPPAVSQTRTTRSSAGAALLAGGL